MQEPPTRKQRLGPTTEQARFQEPNIFSRFLPETWVTADLPIEEVRMYSRPQHVPLLLVVPD